MVHHVVALVDRITKRLSLYIDGVLQETKIGSGVMPSSHTNLYIGNRNGSSILGVVGIIDEFRVYGRLISVEEITSPPRKVYDSSVLIFSFDEGSGFSTNDRFGNYVGQIIGNSTWVDGLVDLKANKFLISSENETQSLISDLNDLIPKMTGDTAPSGISTCSSTFSTSGAYNAFNAFDKSIIQTGSFNSWVTASGQLTGWLAYEFPLATVVNKYTLVHGYNNVNVAPKSWTFEGTNDNGLTWTVLDQKSNVTDWILWTEKEFEFDNIKKFKKYRINISSNNGSTSYVGIQEMKMYDTNRALLICPSISENIFIKYGVSKNEIIDAHKDIYKKSYMANSSAQLGSGKVFKQKIDTNKIPIKKASIT